MGRGAVRAVREEGGTTVVVEWSDGADEVLGGDLTAALAYATPAGGAVALAVAPLGLRDRTRGTVAFTTSMGFGRKLDRLRAKPQVALAYHSREHGFATADCFVVVQGEAEIRTDSDQAEIDHVVEQAVAFTGTLPRGPKRFWTWWLRDYYATRVPVVVTATRVREWPDLRCAGPVRVSGAPEAAHAPSQEPPAKGTGPRVHVAGVARRIASLPHVLLAFLDAGGMPTVVPVDVVGHSPEGLQLRAHPGLIPPGQRRAGLTAHAYGPQCVGIRTRYHTGWLTVDDEGRVRYAPHTEKGFAAPPVKGLMLLISGLIATRGVRRAKRRGASACLPRPMRHSSSL